MGVEIRRPKNNAYGNFRSSGFVKQHFMFLIGTETGRYNPKEPFFWHCIVKAFDFEVGIAFGLPQREHPWRRIDQRDSKGVVLAPPLKT